jgi:hypothetical protein
MDVITVLALAIALALVLGMGNLLWFYAIAPRAFETFVRSANWPRILLGTLMYAIVGGLVIAYFTANR